MLTSSKTRYLNFGLSLHIHLYFVNAGSQGSGKSAHMCICADLPEPSLLADAISSEILCTGPNVFSVCHSNCISLLFNPFKRNGLPYLYQLEELTSYFRVVGWYFSFSFKF